jgi:hypothetical protein
MNKIKKLCLIILMLMAVTVTTWDARSRNLAYVPGENDIFDEKDNVLIGKSFIENGVAEGWSNLTAYTLNSAATVDKLTIPGWKGTQQVFQVKPYIDHPVNTGVIYSLFQKSPGWTYEEIQPTEYRGGTIWIATITGWLLFGFIYLISNSVSTGLIGALLYFTVPTTVLSSRWALGENLVIPASLLCFIFLKISNWGNNKTKIFLVMAGVFAGLAIGFKESGAFAMLAGIIIMTVNRVKVKRMLWYVVPTLIIGGVPFLVNFIIAPGIFWQVISEQSHRTFFGTLNFYTSLIQLNFVNFPVDGWWLWGWIAMAIFILKKRNRELAIIFGSTVFTVFFMGGMNYPWYILIVFPWLITAQAIVLRDLWDEASSLTVNSIFALPFFSAFYWGYQVMNHQQDLLTYRVILVIMLGINWWIWRGVRNKLIWRCLIVSIGLLVLWWNRESLIFIVYHWGNLPDVFQVKWTI